MKLLRFNDEMGKKNIHTRIIFRNIFLVASFFILVYMCVHVLFFAATLLSHEFAIYAVDMSL